MPRCCRVLCRSHLPGKNALEFFFAVRMSWSCTSSSGQIVRAGPHGLCHPRHHPAGAAQRGGRRGDQCSRLSEVHLVLGQAARGTGVEIDDHQSRASGVDAVPQVQATASGHDLVDDSLVDVAGCFTVFDTPPRLSLAAVNVSEFCSFPLPRQELVLVGGSVEAAEFDL